MLVDSDVLVCLGLPLLSANAKHFRPMDELMLEVFVP